MLKEELIKKVEKLERENKILRKKLTSALVMDQLTNLPNLKSEHTKELLVKIIETYERLSVDSWFVLIDLDLFHNVNVMFGYDVGDEVLKAFAKTVRKRLRKSDWFLQMASRESSLVDSQKADTGFRSGGEEFVLILSGLNRELLVKLMKNLHKIYMEGLRDVYRDKQLSWVGIKPGSITEFLTHFTFSCGASQLTFKDSTSKKRDPKLIFEQAKVQADKSLKKAKKSGRNAIIIDSGSRTEISEKHGVIDSIRM